MLQFIAALVMGINAIRIGCDFPMWMQYSCCAYMLSFLVLFSDFYIKVDTKQGKDLQDLILLNNFRHIWGRLVKPEVYRTAIMAIMLPQWTVTVILTVWRSSVIMAIRTIECFLVIIYCYWSLSLCNYLLILHPLSKLFMFS